MDDAADRGLAPRRSRGGGERAPQWRLDHAWYTHPGGDRENQDALRLDVGTGRGLAVVCDGLGGMAEGATAAAICADAIVAALTGNGALDTPLDDAAQDRGSTVSAHAPEPPHTDPLDDAAQDRDAIGQAVIGAHQALLDAQVASPPIKRARATAAVALIARGVLTWANVGDTRVYRFHGPGRPQVSPDDSAGYAAYERGEVDHEGIRLYDGRSHLTAALGDELDVVPHTGRATLAEGDAVLVCSDGFWQYVWDTEMGIDLAKSLSAADWLELMLLRLVQRSRLDGDNLTAVAFTVRTKE